MPGFDKEIARLAQRTLITPRKIDYHTGVLATKVTPGARPTLPTIAYRAPGFVLCNRHAGQSCQQSMLLPSCKGQGVAKQRASSSGDAGGGWG